MITKSKKAAAALNAGNSPDTSGGPARERILAAAEAAFADQGFDGASLRQIAIAAGVPVTLVSYYFNGKDALYRATFERRAPMIIDQRLAGLRLADMESDPDRKLELVVKSLILPMIHLRNTEKNSHYARLLARDISSPNEHSRAIIEEFFDPVANRMLEALAKAMPDKTIEEINWGYHVMLGAMVFIMADNGRIARLSGGRCDPDDETATATHMIALLHAALKHGQVARQPATFQKKI